MSRFIWEKRVDMYRVFLVDDEEQVRKQIRKTIETEMDGFCVCGDAGDGERAFSLILREKPDILVTDIRMPFMDGLELGKLVKGELPRTALIILTGYDEFEYARQGILIGACDYVLKPVTPVKLVQTLERVVKTLEEKESRRKKERMMDRAQERRMELNGILFEERGGVDRETIENFLWFSEKDEVSGFVNKLAEVSFQISGGSQLHFMYCAYDVILTADKTARRMGIDSPFAEISEHTELQIETREDFAAVMGSYLERIIVLRESMADAKTRVAAEARNYIDQNYGDCDLSLSAVADTVGVTANYLSALLKKETGETFSEYLNKVRIRHAVELLKTTDLTFQEIARRSGYRDGFYFSKIFKKTFGLSPRNFKKM